MRRTRLRVEEQEESHDDVSKNDQHENNDNTENEMGRNKMLYNENHIISTVVISLNHKHVFIGKPFFFSERPQGSGPHNRNQNQRGEEAPKDATLRW